MMVRAAVVFYLARTSGEQESKVRAALGVSVWRQAGGSDALFEEYVDPSAYWRAQGLPVRVWGLLADGVLYITVLPEGQAMNRWLYTWVIEKRFPAWLDEAFGRYRSQVFQVQDHERALWTPEPLAAMPGVGVSLLENYPPCSQDLNPIETAWRELRSRLRDTQPVNMEPRAEFVARLRSAAIWVNRNRAEYLMHICNDQEERAHAVRATNGSRTRY